jgi:NAD(P)-dependent dehydrogenase (short-subunit alcohol dehydrogenase family)
MPSSKKRVAIITGASGNLGSSVANKFIKSGINTVLVARSSKKIVELFPEYKHSENVFFAAPIDVLDEHAVKKLIANTLERFGKVDILVNTVGGYRAGTPLYETPIETWDFMFNINVRSVFITCKTVIPIMLENNYGKIVNVSSRAGIYGNENSAAYSASKGAVIRITESMASELLGSGINVNCVIPGTIDTLENRNAMPKANHDKWVSTNSIADLILFLISDAASDINGASIPIYGNS